MVGFKTAVALRISDSKSLLIRLYESGEGTLVPETETGRCPVSGLHSRYVVTRSYPRHGAQYLTKLGRIEKKTFYIDLDEKSMKTTSCSCEIKNVSL